MEQCDWDRDNSSIVPDDKTQSKSVKCVYSCSPAQNEVRRFIPIHVSLKHIFRISHIELLFMFQVWSIHGKFPFPNQWSRTMKYCHLYWKLECINTLLKRYLLLNQILNKENDRVISFVVNIAIRIVNEKRHRIDVKNALENRHCVLEVALNFGIKLCDCDDYFLFIQFVLKKIKKINLLTLFQFHISRK